MISKWFYKNVKMLSFYHMRNHVLKLSSKRNFVRILCQKIRNETLPFYYARKYANYHQQFKVHIFINTLFIRSIELEIWDNQKYWIQAKTLLNEIVKIVKNNVNFESFEFYLDSNSFMEHRIRNEQIEQFNN